MKVQYAPLITSASGRMEGIVATRWKGIPIMRRFTPPAQPRTDAQVDVRNRFRNANKLYPIGTEAFRDSWLQYAESRPAIARNGFIAAMGALDNAAANIDALIPLYQDGRYPGVVSSQIEGAVGEVLFSNTQVYIPEGFTPLEFRVIAIPDFDPNTDQPRSDLRMIEASTTYSAGGDPDDLTIPADDYLIAVTLATSAPTGSGQVVGVSATAAVTVT